MRDAEPPTAVERFLMAQVEERDVEIVELKQTVVRLQCQLLHERERQGRGDPGARASPAARWKGAPDQSFLQARKPTLTVEGALSSTSSIESTGDSEAMLEPEAVGPDSFRIRIVSPSSTTVISPDCAAAEKPAAASNPFVSMLLGCAPVQAAVLAYAGSCEALLHVTPVLAEVINTFCVVEVERFKTEFSLEPGIANESPYERLSASLKRRWRLTAARGADAKTGKASRSIDSKSASSSAFLKAYPRMLSNVRLHAFVTSQLRRQLNTIAINVNTTVSDHCLVRGPRGLDPSFNSLVRQRGVNVGATCTQHSSTQPVDATKSFRWLINRDVRLFYPRGPVPHQLEMLRAVKALGIQPKALVLDVCLVKPKWFPAIQYMVDYTTVILVPEVPSRDALEEGEAQKIRAKFNKYLETSATAGQCLHVVLDSALAAELAKEITTSRVNVLSLDLPDKEGPIGFRGHPQIELLTLLDSVFDDSLTLTVPAEREPIARDFFSPAPGAGGVYKYSPSLTFSFGSAQPGAPPARQGGNRRAPAPPGGPRFSMRPRGDDEEGVSDSSSYSQSSQQSAAELPPPFRNPAAAAGGVYKYSLTLTVPAEREPIARDFFSPAPGAGGVYKYSPSLTFSFGSAQPGAPPARQGGNRRAPAPPGGPRFRMRPRGDDEEGVSGSSPFRNSSEHHALLPLTSVVFEKPARRSGTGSLAHLLVCFAGVVLLAPGAVDSKRSCADANRDDPS
ncbi:hypothetical protein DIPPA_14983 [Diplonema papillatum]|nr:hypothetical protein DIPPA_14983 [Diplonema papillatum]